MSPGPFTRRNSRLPSHDVVPEGGRLVINKDEAASVVSIFELYLEQGSLLAVAQELRILGRTRKTWTTRGGSVRVGREFSAVDLHRLLTDVIYIGHQKLGDETFDGEHDAIVTKKLFDQVQRMLDANRRNSGASHRNRHGALLRGILKCAACDSAMKRPAESRSKLRARPPDHCSCEGRRACDGRVDSEIG